MVRSAVPAFLIAMAIGAAPAMVRAGEGDFTFHMVKPPKPGTKRLITVQVDPAAQQRWIDTPPAVTTYDSPDMPHPPVTRPDAPQTGGVVPGLTGPGLTGPGGQGARAGTPRVAAYGWFWTRVSPALGARAGRFKAALAALATGPGGAQVVAPRRQLLQGMAQKWGADILKSTVGTKVSPALVLAVMAVESGGRPGALSPKGARGLMQLIPATAGRFGVDAADPAQNIKGAVAYLNWLMGEFDGDPLMVLAAYNAGENAVKGADGVPDYAETRDYVPKVLAAWTVARGLCATPPHLVSGGCVFKVMSAQK